MAVTPSDQNNHNRSDTIRSERLFGQRKELKIVHNGVVYTLRITANNKLILTK